MNIRLMRDSDLAIIKDLHDEYYKDSFPFPFNERRQFLDKVIIEDDYNGIILMGTAELGLELVAISNLSLDIKLRREAYYKLMQTIINGASKNFDTISCSVDDKDWERHIKKFGFIEPRHKIFIKRI